MRDEKWQKNVNDNKDPKIMSANKSSRVASELNLCKQLAQRRRREINENVLLEAMIVRHLLSQRQKREVSGVYICSYESSARAEEFQVSEWSWETRNVRKFALQFSNLTFSVYHSLMSHNIVKLVQIESLKVITSAHSQAEAFP